MGGGADIRSEVAEGTMGARDKGPPGAVTGLLQAWQRGEDGAQDGLFRLVYGELRRQASVYLRRERGNHTTALVHEAYLRLVGQRAPFQNRSQFFAVAAQMMRRVLIRQRAP